MNKKKLKNLLESEEFLKKILLLNTCGEIQDEFEKKGLKASLNEVRVLRKVIDAIIVKGKALSEDELSKVVGGCSEDAVIDGMELAVFLGGITVMTSPLLVMGTLKIRDVVLKRRKQKFVSKGTVLAIDIHSPHRIM